MAYDIGSKFTKNSPLPCWKGYKRKPGTTEFSKGSCVKDSPAKKKKKTKAKGGGTTKVCLPKAKIASSGGSLRTWVKQDWRQVGNPSKKCGEK